MPIFSITSAAAIALAVCAACGCARRQIAMDPVVEMIAEPGGYRIEIDGELFTRFHEAADAQKPFYFPLTATRSRYVTRAWPIEEGIAGEARDHPHHVSLWLAHGDVNGHDFWHGPRGERIVHIETGEPVHMPGMCCVMQSFEWRAPDGIVILREDRRVMFIAREDGRRAIAFEITLTAAQPSVTLGDTKEGVFAMRLAPTLRLQGEVAQGSARNSEGIDGPAIWGKRARWVAYSGPLDDDDNSHDDDGDDEGDDAVTVAIFDHPANPRHPTWWHARDYGLVAANAFGVHDFEGRAPGSGDFTLSQGGSMTFRYLILIAPETLENGAIEEQYAEWSRSPFQTDAMITPEK